MSGHFNTIYLVEMLTFFSAFYNLYILNELDWKSQCLCNTERINRCFIVPLNVYVIICVFFQENLIEIKNRT